MAAADDDDDGDAAAAAVQVDPCLAASAVAHADVAVLTVSEVVSVGLSVLHGKHS